MYDTVYQKRNLEVSLVNGCYTEGPGRGQKDNCLFGTRTERLFRSV